MDLATVSKVIQKHPLNEKGLKKAFGECLRLNDAELKRRENAMLDIAKKINIQWRSKK